MLKKSIALIVLHKMTKWQGLTFRADIFICTRNSSEHLMCILSLNSMILWVRNISISLIWELRQRYVKTQCYYESKYRSSQSLVQMEKIVSWLNIVASIILQRILGRYSYYIYFLKQNDEILYFSWFLYLLEGLSDI